MQSASLLKILHQSMSEVFFEQLLFEKDAIKNVLCIIIRKFVFTFDLIIYNASQKCIVKTWKNEYF